MGFLRRTKKEQPLPFNPWMTPPMGSLGDAWDEILDLPKESTEAAREQSERLKRDESRSRKRRKYKPFEIRRPLHTAAIIACVLLAMAATTTGPAAFIIPFLAGGAIITGLTALFLIKKSIFGRGYPEALTAIIGGVALFVVYFASISF